MAVAKGLAGLGSISLPNGNKYDARSLQAVLKHADRASPGSPETFVATALIESGLRPDAVGDGGNSFGLFQLNRAGRLASAGLTPQQAHDPFINARVSADEFATFFKRGARGADLALRSQRPSDPNYKQKFAKALPIARQLLRQAGKNPGSGPGSATSAGLDPADGINTGSAGAGGFVMDAQTQVAVADYLKRTEQQVLRGQTPDDPFQLLGRINFRQAPQKSGGFNQFDDTGGGHFEGDGHDHSGHNHGPIKLSGGYAGTQGAVKSIVGELPSGFSITSEKRDRQNTTSGNMSDHYVGNKVAYANDIGWGSSQPTANSDQLASRIVSRLGGPKNWGKTGGNFVTTINGVRHQVIYRSNVGGNHYNHIHIGARKL